SRVGLAFVPHQLRTPESQFVLAEVASGLDGNELREAPRRCHDRDGGSQEGTLVRAELEADETIIRSDGRELVEALPPFGCEPVHPAATDPLTGPREPRVDRVESAYRPRRR